MATGKLEIEGAKELHRKLSLLPKKVEKKIARRALRAATKPILKQARALAPVDTGKLKQSLKVRAGRRKKGTVAMTVQTRDGDYKGETFYGAFVHFGHRVGPRKLGNKRRFVEPNRYLLKAFHIAKREALAALTRELARGIETGAGALK